MCPKEDSEFPSLNRIYSRAELNLSGCGNGADFVGLDFTGTDILSLHQPKISHRALLLYVYGK